MNPAIVPALIGTLSQQLLSEFVLNRNNEAGKPTEDLLKKTLVRLLGGNFFRLDGGSPTLDKDGVTAVVQWLQRIMGLPIADGVIDTAFIDRLFSTCQGCATGNAGPKNRTKLQRPDPATASREPLDTDPTRWFLYEIQGDLPKVMQGSKNRAHFLLDQAFGQWQDHVNLRVMEKSKPTTTPNLVIRVIPLDGSGQKLAEATLNPGSSLLARFDLLIDSSEKWTPEKFLATLTHEIGHLLGLDHSSSTNDLMYDTLLSNASGAPVFTEPQAGDILRAQQIWGKAV